MLVEARADEHDHNARAGLSAFDPATGRVRDLAALADKGAGVTFWGVSPDGTTVAFGQFAWGGGDQVTLLRLATGEKRIVQLKNFKNLSEIAWAPDGRSLFGTTGTLLGGQVLHIGLDGTTQLLHMFESQIVGNPRPSPDGRLLLVGATSNAWVLELR